MMPTVWTIPGLNYNIPAFGLLMMIGFLAAIIWGAKRAAKSGANPDVILDLGFISLIGGVVGCRVMHVWHNWGDFVERGDAMAIFMAVINVTEGGMEFYGGFILSLVLVFAYLLIKRHSLRWYFDIVAPSLALGMAIGRIGCFMNGCCHGGVCELPWSVTFPAGSPVVYEQLESHKPGAVIPKELLAEAPDGRVYPIPLNALSASDEEIAAAARAEAEARSAELAAQTKLAEAEKTGAQNVAALKQEVEDRAADVKRAHIDHLAVRQVMQKYGISAAEVRAIAARHRSLPVHPAQLYSTVALLILAALLSAAYWRRTRDGQVIFLFFVLEPITRWLLEVVRADNPTDQIWGMTISQFLAVLMIPIGLIGLLWVQRMPPRSPFAKLWVPPEDDEDKKKAKKGGAPAEAATA